MRGLSAPNKQILREAAKRAVQVEKWDLNLKEQEGAWKVLTERSKAISDPDIPSFREKMTPVLANFVNRTGAKGKAFVEAVQAAA
jgi:TRAP-type C4-dicarboxylate transport system substrate-binding protein